MFIRIGLIVLCIFSLWKVLEISGITSSSINSAGNSTAIDINTNEPNNVDPNNELALFSGTELEEVKKELNAFVADKSKKYQIELAQVNEHLANKEYEEANLLLQSTRDQYPDQPELLARHAEVIALMNNGQFSGQPFELLSRALDIDIKHKPSLWMMALVNQQLGNHEAAVILLKLLKREIPPDSNSIETINSAMAMSVIEYENQVDTAPVEEVKVSHEGSAAGSEVYSRVDLTSGAPSINLYITLEPEIVKQFSPDDAVFVYARVGKTESMPLAVTRRQISDFPTTVTLDDSMAMMPAQNLSSSDLVTVGARASRSGTAMALTGDWEVELYDVPIETKELIPLNIHYELK